MASQGTKLSPIRLTPTAARTTGRGFGRTAELIERSIGSAGPIGWGWGWGWGGAVGSVLNLATSEHA